MSAWEPGTVVDRYRIEGVIGAGSMGDVFRGLDIDLHRQVAIKILSERHRENSELRARFVREGRAVAAISHPNVVQVFTTGTSDGRPYIAMELLKGIDLGTAVAERGPWKSLQAARAILDAARGLEAAAHAGLIHRDVKPSNLVLLETGVVKVTDFGLAKPLDPSREPALTAAGVVVGTPDYIAPEQARGDPIDERVDIYALGGTTFFLLAGRPPFRTGRPGEDKYLKVVARHLRNPPPSPREVDPAIDRALDELTRRMMAKAPADRPGYAELIERLSAIVDRLQGRGDATPPPFYVARARSEPVARARSEPISPTPFVGGDTRLPPELAGAGPPALEVSGRAGSRADSAAEEIDGRRGRADADDAAATLIRPRPRSEPAAWPTDVASPPPRRAWWLWMVTALSAAIFLTGLALKLFGPARSHPAAHPARASESGAASAPLGRRADDAGA